jgi:hypothetical protein
MTRFDQTGNIMKESAIMISLPSAPWPLAAVP